MGNPRAASAVDRHVSRRCLLLASLLATACLNFPGKPAVMHNMTQLPDDPDKREQQRESALARPDADSQKKLTRKERTVVTAAASVAALVGMWFSTSPNVLLGTETEIEENIVVDPHAGERDKLHKKEKAEEGKDGAPPPPTNPVPWIQLPPPPPQ